MIDPDRVLRPLEEERPAIDGLTGYETPDELASSMKGAWSAVERSLRHLLRSDPDAPDELRMSALSPADLPYENLIAALSRRNLVSLRVAGMAHQLRQAAERAERGEVQAADADRALETIRELRSEVHALADEPIREVAHQAVETHAIEDAAHEVQGEHDGARRRLAIMLLALAGVTVVAVLLLRGRSDPMREAVAAFQAGQFGAAEQSFLEAARRDESNVTALLYLGRIYRREGRHDEAGDVLLRAVEIAPEDDDLRRELGYLFLDLNRPSAAVQQFRRAQEADPENHMNWVGLIRALRAAGDPQAEEVLLRAPEEVRATLTSGLLPPDTI